MCCKGKNFTVCELYISTIAIKRNWCETLTQHPRLHSTLTCSTDGLALGATTLHLPPFLRVALLWHKTHDCLLCAFTSWDGPRNQLLPSTSRKWIPISFSKSNNKETNHSLVPHEGPLNLFPAKVSCKRQPVCSSETQLHHYSNSRAEVNVQEKEGLTW